MHIGPTDTDRRVLAGQAQPVGPATQETRDGMIPVRSSSRRDRFVAKPEAQDHLATERPASRLIRERIWEQNTMKPAGIGAMRRDGPDA